MKEKGRRKKAGGMEKEKKMNKTKNTRDKGKSVEFERKGYWLKKRG